MRDSLTRGWLPTSFGHMSGLPFELLLALRYLRPKRTFVSVITLISVLGVTLGVAVLIIVISVMSGFDAQLKEKILGFNTHIKILPRYETMPNYAAVANIVSSNRNVKAVAPFVMGPVLLETKSGSSQSRVGAPYIRGIDAQTETNMSVLPNSIVEGKFDVSDRGILVGTTFAESMGIPGHVIHSPQELDNLDFDTILRRKGPTLLDVRIDGEEVPPMLLRMKTLGTLK